MLGTIVNAGAIVLGCALGLLLRRGIPERVTDAVMKGIGLCVIYIGVSGALEGEKTIAMIIAMAAGGASRKSSQGAEAAFPQASLPPASYTA